MFNLLQTAVVGSDAPFRTVIPKKDVGTFKQGGKDRVYIVRMLCKRLMVFSFSFQNTGYAVLKDEKELNACFEEIID